MHGWFECTRCAPELVLMLYGPGAIAHMNETKAYKQIDTPHNWLQTNNKTRLTNHGQTHLNLATMMCSIDACWNPNPKQSLQQSTISSIPVSE